MNPYQTIAPRIAAIANQQARIMRTQNEWDMPDGLQARIDAAIALVRAGSPDEYRASWEVDRAVRTAAADEYAKTELIQLQTEAAAAGVNIDPELIAALLPSIAAVTHWQSSSYGCS